MKGFTWAGLATALAGAAFAYVHSISPESGAVIAAIGSVVASLGPGIASDHKE